MKILNFYPTTILIDDPETGAAVTVRVRVTRMSLDQSSRFKRDYYRSANPPSKALLARRPDGDEQAKGPDGKFLLSDDLIRARRLMEMSDDEREDFDRREDEEEAFSVQFLTRSITDYIAVEPEQLYEDGQDGKPRSITTGADMLRLFGGRSDVLAQLLRAIDVENTWSTAGKNALRSLSASARSSDAPQPVAVGPKPEPTAADAGTAASAPTEDADAQARTRSSSSSAGTAPATPVH